VASLSPGPRRGALVLREVIIVSFFGIVAWAGWQVVGALDGFYMVSLPEVSQQITQSVIPIGAVLFIVAELANFVASWTEIETAAGEAQLQ
jgi:TRAP-type C4-dicarboxylate transport system permease small subunit